MRNLHQHASINTLILCFQITPGFTIEIYKNIHMLEEMMLSSNRDLLYKTFQDNTTVNDRVKSEFMEHRERYFLVRYEMN